MVPGFKHLCHHRDSRVQVESCDQLHWGFWFVGNYDCWCGSKAGCNGAMGHTVSPKLVLGPCRYLGEAADLGMSLLFLTPSGLPGSTHSASLPRYCVSRTSTVSNFWRTLDAVIYMSNRFQQMVGIWLVLLHRCLSSTCWKYAQCRCSKCLIVCRRPGHSFIGSTDFTFRPLVYRHPHVRSSYFTFLSKLMHMDTGLLHPPEPIEISSNISRSKVPTFRFCNTAMTLIPAKLVAIRIRLTYVVRISPRGYA